MPLRISRALWLTVGAALWRRQLARLDEPDEEVPQDPIIELHEDNFEDMLGPPPLSPAALRSLRKRFRQEERSSGLVADGLGCWAWVQWSTS